MKSLVYHLRDDMIRGYQKLLSNPEINTYPKDAVLGLKNALKHIKDPTIDLIDLIRKAHKFADIRAEHISKDPERFGLNDDTARVFGRNIVQFYALLKGIYGVNGDFLKKYYYFVPDFAENLKKVKIPNLDKLTLNDVFHGRETYFELIFKEHIVTITIFKNNKSEICNFIVTYYMCNRHEAPIPAFINAYKTQVNTINSNVIKEKSIGSCLFKEAWEKCATLSFYEAEQGDWIGETEGGKGAEIMKGVWDTNFIASCLLYIKSGDPDIRHMKGENPQKYKLNAKDSFFEKRKKQEGVKDAIFNDYEIVGWNYKKKYNVAGHWRYQACGPKWSQHKLIFIESFEKGNKK